MVSYLPSLTSQMSGLGLNHGLPPPPLNAGSNACSGTCAAYGAHSIWSGTLHTAPNPFQSRSVLPMTSFQPVQDLCCMPPGLTEIGSTCSAVPEWQGAGARYQIGQNGYHVRYSPGQAGVEVAHTLCPEHEGQSLTQGLDNRASWAITLTSLL